MGTRGVGRLSWTTGTQRHLLSSVGPLSRFAEDCINHGEESSLPADVQKSRLLKVICRSGCPQLGGLARYNLADNDYGNVLGARVSLQRVQHLFSSDAGQQQVQQDEVRYAFVCQSKPFLAIVSKEHQVARFEKNPLAGQFLDFAVFH